MKSIITLSFVCMMAFSGCGQPGSITAIGTSKTNGPYTQPTDVLKAGKFNVRVMQIALPEEVDVLGKRMQEAIAKDPAWFQDAMQNVAPGEPLPYDERCGLTEAEYNRMLDLSKQASMKQIGTTTLGVTEDSDGVFILDGSDRLQDFNGLIIDLNEDVVSTPYGRANKKSEIHASEKSAHGAWDGTSWKFSDFDPNRGFGSNIEFAVGRLKPSGTNIMYYRATDVSQGKKYSVRLSLYFK